jgi:hypothetical protein
MAREGEEWAEGERKAAERAKAPATVGGRYMGPRRIGGLRRGSPGYLFIGNSVGAAGGSDAIASNSGYRSRSGSGTETFDRFRRLIS